MPDAASSDHLQPPVGIDLGTTLSVVAYIDPSGRPVTLPNRSGDLLTPSALVFDSDGVVVGREAVKGSVLDPDAFADGFKRDMGRAAFHRRVCGHDVPPEVFSAFLLARLKEDAENRLGPIRQVVITVPAFFDETRRKSTQEAGRLAGLDVLDIINEPTAAAIAFGYHRAALTSGGRDQVKPADRILVYDLGGGTFDVTILQIDGDTLRTVATDGDVLLGGRDFDERLFNRVAERFVAEHGLDPRGDPHDAARLWLDVQEAKHALTERRKTTVVCHHQGIRMRQEITREEFEDLSQDLLGRTETTTELVVRQAGLSWEQIDRVLLVGGSTRMPMVVEMLRRISGQQPDRSQSADEVVAHGAALYAALLMTQSRTTSVPVAPFELVNVNSHSLGVVGVHPTTGERVNVTLIPKNTPLPACKVKRFQTARTSQPSVRVAVVEGESPRPEHCIALGQCAIRDLPPGLAKGTPIEVEFQYAANGRLSVSARVPSVRQSAHVEIERARSVALDDLETWRRRLAGEPVASDDGPPGAELPEDADRASLLKRLDEIYIWAGMRAVALTVPEALLASREAAVAAAAALAEAQRNRDRLARAREETTDPREIVRLDPQLPRAELALQSAKTKSRFAHLILGRECVESGFLPPELARYLPEIQRLRKALDG
ncbi:MAG: Hsp70 family protein [Pirellulales bacterium]|nr:Hsp70 family protein [Pirellulales bacterium]